MKLLVFTLSSFLLLASCGNKTSDANVTDAVKDSVVVNQSEQSAITDDDKVICDAIRNFLLNKPDAAVLTKSAKSDLMESTWPEVACSVEGMLDSPAGFRNLTVKKVGEGRYRYECVCPDHGDRYVDCCTIHAILDPDGVVKIQHVTWDDATHASDASLSGMLKNCSWYKTEYGFKMPDFMMASSPIFVDDVPADMQKWTYGGICVACWPMLGAWAVMEYPDSGNYLTEDVMVRNVTYANGVGIVFSGYTDDGRIWYMKKRILDGGDVTHAAALVLIYPKENKDEVNPLINIVKKW